MDFYLERVRVGLESYWACSRAFWCTLFGTKNEQTSMNEQQQFYLNPYGAAVEAGSDWIVLLLLFLLVHTVSWWGRWFLWEPLARQRIKRPTQRNVRKFSAIATANLFHTLSAIFAWRILYHRDWLLARSEWNVRQETVDTDLKSYYLLYAARYASDAISLFYEIPKEDTWAFAVHHVVTVLLVLGSAQGGYTRIGSVFMFFLDWVDIVLTAAKLCKYMSFRRNDGWQFLADRLFEVFVVSFFITRNGILNYVAYACLVDFENTPLKALALMLVGLMTYWLVLIIKAVIHQLFGNGSFDDLRESDDEEEFDKQK